MRRFRFIVEVAVTAWCVTAGVTACRGHGLQPIVVGVTGGKLTVSGGYSGAGGFAANVFADPDEEAPLTVVPINGGLLYTTLPGFTLQSTLAVGSGLFLEAVPRKQLGDAAGQPRWLWQWRQATELVEVAPSDPALEVITDFDGGIDVRQFGVPASTSVQIAAPTAQELGGHGDFLRPLLDNSPAAQPGVYGMFARLTSPTYLPSAPFLIALNLGLDDPDVFKTGALAINAAAGLAGDYDVDGDVDGTDALVWQRGVGSIGGAGSVAGDGTADGKVDGADLAVWASQFGSASPVATPLTGAVPEPAGIGLAMLAVGGSRRFVRRGRR